MCPYTLFGECHRVVSRMLLCQCVVCRRAPTCIDCAVHLLTSAVLREIGVRLPGQLSEAVAELDSARGQASEARATTARLEADLEGLSSAYSNLEAHAFAVERRMGEHEAEAGSAGECRQCSLSTCWLEMAVTLRDAAALLPSLRCSPHIRRRRGAWWGRRQGEPGRRGKRSG